MLTTSALKLGPSWGNGDDSGRGQESRGRPVRVQVPGEGGGQVADPRRWPGKRCASQAAAVPVGEKRDGRADRSGLLAAKGCSLREGRAVLSRDGGVCRAVKLRLRDTVERVSGTEARRSAAEGGNAALLRYV
eukprot:scaffold672_cov268-Pinguiococcus_pyrenoidosus.AAC.1